MAGLYDILVKVGLDDVDFFKGASKLIPGLNKILGKGGLAGFGIKGLAATAFTMAAREIGKAIDELEEYNHELVVSARNTGAGVEQLQGWSKQMKRFGGDVTTVTSLLDKLELSRSKALEEGPEGKITKAFERLGITKEKLAEMSPAQIFEDLQKRMQALGGTSAQMVPLTTIFGKLSKETDILNENLDESIQKLKERRKFIDEPTSRMMELMREQNKEMGGWWSQLVTGAKSPKTLAYLKEVGTYLKEELKLAFTPTWQLPGALKEAKGRFDERVEVLSMTPELMQAQERFRAKKAQRAQIQSQLEQIDEDLKPKGEKIGDIRKRMAERATKLGTLKKGSTAYLQAQLDQKKDELALQNLTGNIGTPSFGTNPFLQIGGLMGVDTSYRIMALQERIAAATEATAQNTSVGGPQTTPPSYKPLLSYTGETTPTGGKKFTVPGTSVTGTDFSR